MIIVRLDRVLADRKMKLSDLANEIDITVANLSNLKTGKAKAIRFTTLDAICKALDCQPADIMEYTNEEIERKD
ncbi:helix-turn-helix domain-containing protein [Staphylococcus casei]|uniref:Helix-turn-helix transcriptional regulator n=1 Tax=Staphylococcus casei TaxID=201828 RepID=A0ABZ2WEU6_9STAP